MTMKELHAYHSLTVNGMVVYYKALTLGEGTRNFRGCEMIVFEVSLITRAAKNFWVGGITPSTTSEINTEQYITSYTRWYW